MWQLPYHLGVSFTKHHALRNISLRAQQLGTEQDPQKATNMHLIG